MYFIFFLCNNHQISNIVVIKLNFCCGISHLYVISDTTTILYYEKFYFYDDLSCYQNPLNSVFGVVFDTLCNNFALSFITNYQKKLF